MLLTKNVQVVGTTKPKVDLNEQVNDFLKKVKDDKEEVVVFEQIKMATEQSIGSVRDPNATVTES